MPWITLLLKCFTLVVAWGQALQPTSPPPLCLCIFMSGRWPCWHGIKLSVDLHEKSSYFLLLLILAVSLPRSSVSACTRMCMQPLSQHECRTFPKDFKGCCTFFYGLKKSSGKAPACSLGCATGASLWEQWWGEFKQLVWALLPKGAEEWREGECATFLCHGHLGASPKPHLKASRIEFAHKKTVRKSLGSQLVRQSWRGSIRDIWLWYSLKTYNCYLQVATRPVLIMSKICKVLNCLCDISINNAEIWQHFHIPPLMSECLWLNPSSLAFIAVCYTNKWDYENSNEGFQWKTLWLKCHNNSCMHLCAWLS